MVATSDTCEDIPLLRKEIKHLRDEIQRLKRENVKKDKIISRLKSSQGDKKSYLQIVKSHTKAISSGLSTSDLSWESSSIEASEISESESILSDYAGLDNSQLIEMLQNAQKDNRLLQEKLSLRKLK